MAEEHAAPGHEEAARLEAALDRIWHAGARRAPTAPAQDAPQSNTELAARLDALIADIRAALGRDSAD